MEKVIAGLKECLELLNCIGTQSECKKYVSDAITFLKKQDETIKELQNAYGYLQNQFFDTQDKLLKEQEAVEPNKVKGYNPPMYTHYDYECEECKSPMMNKQPFCMGCGKPVKWE